MLKFFLLLTCTIHCVHLRNYFGFSYQTESFVLTFLDVENCRGDKERHIFPARFLDVFHSAYNMNIVQRFCRLFLQLLCLGETKCPDHFWAWTKREVMQCSYKFLLHWSDSQRSRNFVCKVFFGQLVPGLIRAYGRSDEHTYERTWHSKLLGSMVLSLSHRYGCSAPTPIW